MIAKSTSHSDNTQSPLSVLDVFSLDSPETVGRQRSSFGNLPPRGRQSVNTSLQKLSTDEGIRLSLPATRPALTACSTSPTRPHSRNKVRLRSNFLSRSSSLNDNKVLIATKLQRTPSLACPDLFTFADHFAFEGILGRSSHTEVFQVRHKRTGDLFAIKKSTRRFASKAHRQRCLHEIMAVAALPAHENIVGQYRAWQQGGHFNIQMELCEGGSLAQLLSELQEAGVLLSEEELWYVLSEMAQGLNFLHANGVLHLDVKPDNIYRDANGILKLGDFGLAVLRHQWDWEEGDGKYVAPELLDATVEPTPAADIYSLGATLYECATGQTLPRTGPFSCLGHPALHGRSAALQNTLQCMLQADATARPTAEDLVSQAQGWDIPVQFSSTRPDRHEEGATVAKEPIAAFQAMSGSAPSLPNSPFMSCCGDDWQSTPTSTPHLIHPKPPRITPPPPFTDHQPPAAIVKVSSSSFDDLFDSASAALENQKASVVSVTGFDSSNPHPVPSCSPEVKRFPGTDFAPAQKVTESAQANCPKGTKLQLECLPCAESSVTPSPAHHPARCRARSMPPAMDESMEFAQSRVRPFPNLTLDTEDLAGAALHGSNHSAHIHTRDAVDDGLKCRMPQRQHWSRQPVCNSLTMFATHGDSCNSVPKDCVIDQRIGNSVYDASGTCKSPRQFERCSARQSLNDTLPCGNDSMIWATDTADGMPHDEELAIGSLDRSYSVMSLS